MNLRIDYENTKEKRITQLCSEQVNFHLEKMNDREWCLIVAEETFLITTKKRGVIDVEKKS